MRVLHELRAARKQSHWMWFIFPQFAGLGGSAMAQRFAIQSRGEAVAYAAHPLLGQRLRECASVVLAAPPETSLDDFFGYPDDLKLRSSMTLFSAITQAEPLFQNVLDRFFPADPDPATLRLLGQ